jgi:hypothetical protein
MTDVCSQAGKTKDDLADTKKSAEDVAIKIGDETDKLTSTIDTLKQLKTNLKALEDEIEKTQKDERMIPNNIDILNSKYTKLMDKIIKLTKEYDELKQNCDNTKTHPRSCEGLNNKALRDCWEKKGHSPQTEQTKKVLAPASPQAPVQSAAPAAPQAPVQSAAPSALALTLQPTKTTTEDIPLSPAPPPDASKEFNTFFTEITGERSRAKSLKARITLNDKITKFMNENSLSDNQKRALKKQKLIKYELIENEDEFYMAKYLKYKEKYLQLKQMLNN